MSLSGILAQNLREELAKQNITQAGLADMAGLARVSVSQIITGRYMPRLATLECISEALGVPAFELLRERATDSKLPQELAAGTKEQS